MVMPLRRGCQAQSLVNFLTLGLAYGIGLLVGEALRGDGRGGVARRDRQVVAT